MHQQMGKQSHMLDRHCTLNQHGGEDQYYSGSKQDLEATC
uniref:Uncharacterized protein n=1 Tax=Arundo donax TaxID=35708 RepID=A0A0A9GC70_ARUDO